MLALALAVQAEPSKQTLDAIREATRQLRSRDVETRRYAARELTRYRGACLVALSKIVKSLGDDDETVRYFITAAIKRIGARAVPELVDEIDDRDPRVRAGICEILLDEELLPHAGKHLEELAELLDDRDASVRRQAVALFAASGKPAIDPLLDALKSRREETRRAAAEALSGAGAEAPRRLGTALEDERRARVRAGICFALGRMGKKAVPACPVLAKVVKNDSSEEVRAAAARAIGKTGVGFDTVGDALFAGLAHDSETIRDGFVDGLAAYGAPATDGLIERLGSANARERDGAVEALCRMGRPAIHPLEGVLEKGTDKRRLAAIDIFLRLRWAARRRFTLRGLRACLKSESAPVRATAATAFGELARTEVVPHKPESTVPDALLEVAGDTDPAVRAAALTSLGRLGVREAREVFEKAQKDEDGAVRVAGHYGQWAVDGDASRALEQLRAALRDPKTRAAAATALGRMASAAEPAVEELAGLLEDEAPAVRVAAVRALGTIVRPGRAELRELRGTWTKRAPADVRKAIERGLLWLEKNADADGGWDSDAHGGGGIYDPGVTGLALWAFLGAGVTDSPTVNSGLDTLLEKQDLDGVIGSRRSHSFLSYHSFATIALAEAWLLTGRPRYAHAVQQAVDFNEWARNPGLAWRYEPRGGENDTHITMEVATAARLADLAGADVKPGTYDGAARWIEFMTDPGYGQIGYNYPGGLPARPEKKVEVFPPEKSQAMTAAGAWTRQILGGKALESDTLPKSIELCLKTSPSWSLPFRDQFYHHFGSLAVYQHGRKAWRQWEDALHRAYLEAQEDDGSWAPTGVWGADGGRVYSTSMAVLSLLTPYRYPSGFAADPRPDTHERKAIRALEGATRDDDPAVAAAAARALQRIGPRE